MVRFRRCVWHPAGAFSCADIQLLTLDVPRPFLSQTHSELQDIITFAKGITSGYQPLGGCIISDRLLESVSGDENEGSKWQVGYTYSGHPCACAAGIANLELMEESNILEHVQGEGGYPLKAAV